MQVSIYRVSLEYLSLDLIFSSLHLCGFLSFNFADSLNDRMQEGMLMYRTMKIQLMS